MANVVRHSHDAVRRAYAGRDALCRLLLQFPNMPEDRVERVMVKIRECNEIIATDPNNEPWQLDEVLDETFRTIGDRVDWYYCNHRSDEHGKGDDHDRRQQGQWQTESQCSVQPCDQPG